jgi:hypothetical protein
MIAEKVTGIRIAGIENENKENQTDLHATILPKSSLTAAINNHNEKGNQRNQSCATKRHTNDQSH